MSDTQRYTFTGINHRKDGELLESGAEVELTDSEYAAAPHKFEPVGDADASSKSSANATEDSDGEDGEDGENAAGDDEIAGAEEFVDNNVGPIQEAIEAGDADDHLAAVREAENEGENRSTVHDALDDRAEETGEDAGDRTDE
jgi:hypothetical protein